MHFKTSSDPSSSVVEERDAMRRFISSDETMSATREMAETLARKRVRLIGHTKVHNASYKGAIDYRLYILLVLISQTMM